MIHWTFKLIYFKVFCGNFYVAISINIFHYYHYQSFKNVLSYNLFFYIYDAPDSPHNQRPQFIIMGKESTEIIAEVIKRVDRERQALHYVRVLGCENQELAVALNQMSP